MVSIPAGMIVIPAGSGSVPDAKAGQKVETSLFQQEKRKFLREYIAINSESAAYDFAIGVGADGLASLCFRTLLRMV